MATDKNPGFFLRCWIGRARLWQAYWLVGVLGQTFAMLLVVLLGTLLWHSPQDNLWFNSVGAAILVGWSVFAAVSIWRCAPNTSQPVWGAIARVVLVMSVDYGVYAAWRAL